MNRLVFAIASLVGLVAAAAPLAAQEAPSGWTGGLGVRLIPVVTHATPSVAGEDRRELYLTQPVLMVQPGRSAAGSASTAC